MSSLPEHQDPSELDPPNWFGVPEAILPILPELTSAEIKILLVLCAARTSLRRADAPIDGLPDDPLSRTSATLVEVTRLNKATVVRALNALVERNLAVSEGAGRATRYRLKVASASLSRVHAPINDLSFNTTTSSKGEGHKAGTSKAVVARETLFETEDSLFAEFWEAWPVGHKNGKKDAEKVWKKLRVDRKKLDEILAGLAAWKLSERWTNGFVMAPARWLRAEAWTEDAPAPKKTNGAADRSDFGRPPTPEQIARFTPAQKAMYEQAAETHRLRGDSGW